MQKNDENTDLDRLNGVLDLEQAALTTERVDIPAQKSGPASVTSTSGGHASARNRRPATGALERGITPVVFGAREIHPRSSSPTARGGILWAALA